MHRYIHTHRQAYTHTYKELMDQPQPDPGCRMHLTIKLGLKKVIKHKPKPPRKKSAKRGSKLTTMKAALENKIKSEKMSFKMFASWMKWSQEWLHLGLPVPIAEHPKLARSPICMETWSLPPATTKIGVTRTLPSPWRSSEGKDLNMNHLYDKCRRTTLLSSLKSL